MIRIDAFSFPAPAPLRRGWSRPLDGGNWVTRQAVFAGFFATLLLAAIAVPAFAFHSGPPMVGQLPASSKARTPQTQSAPSLTLPAATGARQ